MNGNISSLASLMQVQDPQRFASNACCRSVLSAQRSSEHALPKQYIDFKPGVQAKKARHFLSLGLGRQKISAINLSKILVRMRKIMLLQPHCSPCPRHLALQYKGLLPDPKHQIDTTGKCADPTS